MKTKKNLLINVLSTIFLITLLTSCAKEKIDNAEIPDAGISDQLYEQKLQALITSNNSTARQLGINFPTAKDTIRQSFKSYQEAYEFVAALKKGVTTTKTDTAVVHRSLNKAMSTLAATYGVDNFSYSVFCSNAASISGTWGSGTMTGNWSVSGNIGYSWTQNSPTSPKAYSSAMPSGTNLSDPFMAYSGVGTMTASGGGWNGSAASYSMEKSAQIHYSVGSLNGSAAVRVRISSNIGWTPTPQSVFVTHTMTAQAY